MAAVIIGFAKTAVSTSGSLAVVIFATVLSARESTGALLPLLLIGDLVAVCTYRKHAHLPTLLRLIPGVIPGMLLGAVFLRVASESVMRPMLGAILLAMVGLQLLQRRATPKEQPLPGRPERWSLARRWWRHLVLAAGAGFATMTANAAGPVMTLYLLLAGLSVADIVGTGAWFYLCVNLAKLPFSVALGFIDAPTLRVTAMLIPALAVGAAAGYVFVRHVDRRRFEDVALGLSAVAAALLLV